MPAQTTPLSNKLVRSMQNGLPPTLHLEMWVSPRKNRAKMKRVLRRVYSLARPLTRKGGGNGPWVYLVNPDQVKSRTPRLRTILGVESQEDLWIELAFYPDKVGMRRIIQHIRKQPKFIKIAGGLDGLYSKRKRGYEGTLAYGLLQRL